MLDKLAIYASFDILVIHRNFINKIFLSHGIRAKNPRSTLITVVAAAAAVAAREPPRLR